MTEREQTLPNPGRANPQKVEALVRQIRDRLQFARGVSEIHRTPQAEEVWAGIYEELAANGQPGLCGRLLARAAAHLVRLSALYALYARSRVVDVEHLRAAVALFDYVADSVQILFGGRSGNRHADVLVASMLPGQELDHSEIRSDVFNNHIYAGDMAEALEIAEALGAISRRVEETGGRPRLVVRRLVAPWETDGTRAESVFSAESPSPPAGGGA